MKKNGKITLLVLAAGFVLCLAERIYIISVGTDMLTGFLYHDSKLLCNIMYYGTLALTMVGAVIAAHFDERGGFGERTAADLSGTRSTVIIGMGMLVSALSLGYEGFIETKAFSPSKYLIVLDFVFAVVFAVIAYATLYKKAFTPGLGFSYSFGGVYYIARGIYNFNNRMAIATVPEYLIEALSIIGAAVFFVMLAKLLSGNCEKLTKKAFCGWGAGAAVLALSSSAATALSKLIAPNEVAQRITMSLYDAEKYYQVNHGADAYMLVFTPVVNVVTGLFIAVTMFTLLLSGKSAKNK